MNEIDIWKKLALSLQDSVIPIREHKRNIQNLRERWVEELTMHKQTKDKWKEGRK